MSYKHQLGKIMLGAAGLFGMEKMISKDEIPVAIVKPSDEISTELMKDSRNDEHKPDKQIDEVHVKPETDTARATREIKNLPHALDLPTLKGLPEKLPEVVERPEINPYLDLDHAKAFIVDVFQKINLKCTDRRRRSGLDEFIPSGTIGLSLDDAGTEEEEPYFNVQIDMMSGEEWASLFALTFHPEQQNIEIIPDPEIQEFVPPLIVSKDPEELQIILMQYIERVKLARAYALTGMTYEEIKRHLEEQEKKSKKATEHAVIAKN